VIAGRAVITTTAAATTSVCGSGNEGRGESKNRKSEGLSEAFHDWVSLWKELSCCFPLTTPASEGRGGLLQTGREKSAQSETIQVSGQLQPRRPTCMIRRKRFPQRHLWRLVRNADDKRPPESDSGSPSKADCLPDLSPYPVGLSWLGSSGGSTASLEVSNSVMIRHASSGVSANWISSRSSSSITPSSARNSKLITFDQ